MRRFLFPLFLVAVLAEAAVSELGSSPVATAETADVTRSDAISGQAAPPRSLTAIAVAAAVAFKSSLDASQQATLQKPFQTQDEVGLPSKASGWSNLPVVAAHPQRRGHGGPHPRSARSPAHAAADDAQRAGLRGRGGDPQG